MPAVKNLEDFNKLRQEVKSWQQARDSQAQVLVALGSCGIARGAADTWTAVQLQLAAEGLDNVEAIATGCIGLCHSEPVVQIKIAGQPTVTYGNVTAEIASRIVKEHLRLGQVLTDFVVPGGAA